MSDNNIWTDEWSPGEDWSGGGSRGKPLSRGDGLGASVHSSRCQSCTVHSFLAFIAEDDERLEARALLGFSLGFSIHNATFTYEAPVALAPSVWDGNRSFLAREHPAWGFADGYRSH